MKPGSIAGVWGSREGDPNRGPDALRALDFDLAAVCGDDVVHYGQPQARPCRGRRLDEALEHPRQELGWDPFTVVVDAHDHLVAGRLDPDPHRPSGRGVTERV